MNVKFTDLEIQLFEHCGLHSTFYENVSANNVYDECMRMLFIRKEWNTKEAEVIRQTQIKMNNGVNYRHNIDVLILSTYEKH